MIISLSQSEENSFSTCVGVVYHFKYLLCMRSDDSNLMALWLNQEALETMVYFYWMGCNRGEMLLKGLPPRLIIPCQLFWGIQEDDSELWLRFCQETMYSVWVFYCTTITANNNISGFPAENVCLGGGGKPWSTYFIDDTVLPLVPYGFNTPYYLIIWLRCTFVKLSTIELFLGINLGWDGRDVSPPMLGNM